MSSPARTPDPLHTTALCKHPQQAMDPGSGAGMTNRKGRAHGLRPFQTMQNSPEQAQTLGFFGTVVEFSMAQHALHCLKAPCFQPKTALIFDKISKNFNLLLLFYKIRQLIKKLSNFNSINTLASASISSVDVIPTPQHVPDSIHHRSQPTHWRGSSISTRRSIAVVCCTARSGFDGAPCAQRGRCQAQAPAQKSRS